MDKIIGIILLILIGMFITISLLKYSYKRIRYLLNKEKIEEGIRKRREERAIKERQDLIKNQKEQYEYFESVQEKYGKENVKFFLNRDQELKCLILIKDYQNEYTIYLEDNRTSCLYFQLNNHSIYIDDIRSNEPKKLHASAMLKFLNEIAYINNSKYISGYYNQKDDVTVFYAKNNFTIKDTIIKKDRNLIVEDIKTNIWLSLNDIRLR